MSCKMLLSMGLVGVMAFSALPAFAAEGAGDPYPLATCVLSGKTLTAEAVVVEHEGRQIKFCCNNCKGKFEADPAAVISKLDEAIVKDQKPVYPLDTCIVSGDKIDPEKASSYVYNNRLFLLCCADCADAIKKDPASFISKLDAAVVEKQQGSYQLAKCPVSGEDLGSMGDPVNAVIGNHLVKLCCKGCEKKLRAEPAKYIAQLEGGAAAGEGIAKKKAE